MNASPNLLNEKHICTDPFRNAFPHTLKGTCTSGPPLPDNNMSHGDKGNRSTDLDANFTCK